MLSKLAAPGSKLMKRPRKSFLTLHPDSPQRKGKRILPSLRSKSGIADAFAMPAKGDLRNPLMKGMSSAVANKGRNH